LGGRKYRGSLKFPSFISNHNKPSKISFRMSQLIPQFEIDLNSISNDDQPIEHGLNA
jgi:hypothetical protein